MIEIENLINENMICIDMKAKNKEEALNKIVELISENGKLSLPEKVDKKNIEEVKAGFLKSVKDREETFSTSVGYSFAIPHGKTDFVKEPVIAYTRLENEIQWSDEEKIKHIFLIGVPEKDAGNEHLEILIKLSTAILEDEFRESLEKAVEKKEVLELLKKYANRER